MGAATTTTATRSCAAATASCLWTYTCPAAHPRPRPWCTASCSCRRRSAAPGPSSVAELAELASALPGVERAGIESGEFVIHASRDDVETLLRRLRDDPAFSCEQLMDLCGVDWPE